MKKLLNISVVLVTLGFASQVSAASLSLKFHEQSGISLENGLLKQVGENDNLLDIFTPAIVEPELATINNAISSVKAQVVETYADFSKEELLQWKITAEEFWQEEMEDLTLYFSIPIADELEGKNLINMIKNASVLENVEIIPDPEPAMISTPSFSPFQGYLLENENGIGAIRAWELPGGRGESVNVVDVEGAWRLDHEDLGPTFYNSGQHTPNSGWRNHGTAVMGVVGAKNNEFGVTGIASEASLGVQSVFIGGNNATARAITNAAFRAGRGGIIIIEVHFSQSDFPVNCACSFQCGYVPAEYYFDNYDAIKQAVGNGVIVIEAAGNGEVDFDNPVVKNRLNTTTRDSGAIMVAASNSGNRLPSCFTNYGSRINAHGWGDNVVTLGYGDAFSGGGAGDERRFYTTGFGGTSSASPIVAGAAASIQGIVKASGQTALNPLEMRSLLVSTGKPQDNSSKQIGRLPNILAAVESRGIAFPLNITLTPILQLLLLDD